ncbi:MAG: CRISPR system Cascade subunit CasA [Rubritalea sp.]|jgi:CRISPR system Cascade subunit CasA
MNLLTDDFISTTEGKVSLKTLLCSGGDYQLKYAFDETQLSVLQLLSSLATVVLKPSLQELKAYLREGVAEEQYQKGLAKVDLSCFSGDRFMRSKFPDEGNVAQAPITKLVSGIECGESVNALGLFSDTEQADQACSDCCHVLNYNLHMNIKGECFGPSGATGIRGGGSLSTLISGANLQTTILANTIAVDFYNEQRGIPQEALNNQLMWEDLPQGDIYYAHQIGLERGLFALAYHIDFSIIEEPCICDICGHSSPQTVKYFSRLKYKGSYGSTKNGRDSNAQWWPHPFTPVTQKADGVYPVCAREQHWQSWVGFVGYVAKKETEKVSSRPAYIVDQYSQLRGTEHVNLLIGGNIADQGSIVGRVYDLYAMPTHWHSDMERVIQVIDSGLVIKNLLSEALNKMFSVGYDKNFIAGIKKNAMHQYISNAQAIVQEILLDVDRSEARVLRKRVLEKLQREARAIFTMVVRKYEHDLPLFKALIKGEKVFFKAMAE